MPDLTLKKKSMNIAYNLAREVVARDEWRKYYVHTNENEAELLTKNLSGKKRKVLVCNILHNIYQS